MKQLRNEATGSRSQSNANVNYHSQSVFRQNRRRWRAIYALCIQELALVRCSVTSCALGNGVREIPSS
jgi:hypothetical protein